MKRGINKSARPQDHLPDVGTRYDEDRTVILCPVCEEKTLDFYAICCHCGWEYDGFPEDHYSAANGTTLADYRKAYRQSLLSLSQSFRKDVKTK